eukprot:scaffold62365_cov52-Phaeocystis_antarctica.AAC.2
MVGLRFNSIGVSDGISNGTDGMAYSLQNPNPNPNPDPNPNPNPNPNQAWPTPCRAATSSPTASRR